jgi:hypothetical protein
VERGRRQEEAWLFGLVAANSVMAHLAMGRITIGEVIRAYMNIHLRGTGTKQQSTSSGSLLPSSGAWPAPFSCGVEKRIFLGKATYGMLLPAWPLGKARSTG